jgi:hypothetical protein
MVRSSSAEVSSYPLTDPCALSNRSRVMIM